MATKTTHKKPYPAISPQRPELSQSGRTVLITGGASGIGLAISRAFIAASASRLVIVGRRESVIDDAIAELTGEVDKQGGSTVFLGKSCDIADLESSGSLWDQLITDGVYVDTMVLNAASPAGPGPILGRGSAKIWDDFTANVRPTIYFTERFYKQGDGGGFGKKHLINISTSVIHGWDGPGKNIPSYALTKNSAALFLQQVALHVSADEMQIVSFNPGTVLTETVRKLGLDENSGIPWDDVHLPGHFSVWAASPEAELLHGRFVWARWDVDELLSGETREQLENSANYLRIGVIGLG